MILIDGEPWWVLKDVCDVLGLTNPSMIADRLDDDERAKLNLGRQGETNIISESGLYDVIVRSDKPEAKLFRRWITHEVLPSIRKRGVYATNDLLSNPELLFAAVQELKDAVSVQQQQLAEMNAKLVELFVQPPCGFAVILGDGCDRHEVFGV